MPPVASPSQSRRPWRQQTWLPRAKGARSPGAVPCRTRLGRLRGLECDPEARGWGCPWALPDLRVRILCFPQTKFILKEICHYIT